MISNMESAELQLEIPCSLLTVWFVSAVLLPYIVCGSLTSVRQVPSPNVPDLSDKKDVQKH